MKPQAMKKIFKILQKEFNIPMYISIDNIKLSNSIFNRDHLINIYTIRKKNAREGNKTILENMINSLLTSLKEEQNNNIRAILINAENYTGLFYLDENLERIIGGIIEEEEKLRK